MRRILLGLLALMLGARAFAATTCTQTVGQLALSCKVMQGTGVSPFLANFDCTATTDSKAKGGANTVFQDVHFGFQFGDPNTPSGTGTWPWGARPNQLSKNKMDGGPLAAHLYVKPVADATDSTYTTQVNATDGTNTARCDLTVTVYGPSGTNGYPGLNTFCVANTTAAVAGQGGCPAGASTPAATNSLTTALNNLANGKRVLLKCGSSFSGSHSFPQTASKQSVGVYGGCENTQTGRPTITNTSGNVLTFNTNNPTDIAITDLDFEDNTLTANAVTSNGAAANQGVTRVVLYNIKCYQLNTCLYLNLAQQSGMIQNWSLGMKSMQVNYLNFGESTCKSGNRTLNCGQGSYDPANYIPTDHNAVLGNHFDGLGGLSGSETMRISACRYCIVSYNDFLNSSAGWGAALKFHGGNYGSQATWMGEYLEYNEVTDNYISGTSGTQIVELAPQNSGLDERHRFLIFERNFMIGQPVTKVVISGQNMTARNNVITVDAASTGTTSDYQLMFTQRGNFPAWISQYNEAFNNTCYARRGVVACVGLVGAVDGMAGVAPTNSWAQNNLFFDAGAASNAVVNSGGASNTVTPNAGATTFGITQYGAMMNFKPTQNYTGGVCTPAYFDAAGLSRVGACGQMGAVTQAAPAQ